MWFSVVCCEVATTVSARSGGRLPLPLGWRRWGRQSLYAVGEGVGDPGEGGHVERQIRGIDLVERVGGGVVPVEVARHVLVDPEDGHAGALERDQIGARFIGRGDLV